MGNQKRKEVKKMSQSALTGNQPFVRKARHHEEALAKVQACY